MPEPGALAGGMAPELPELPELPLVLPVPPVPPVLPVEPVLPELPPALPAPPAPPAPELPAPLLLSVVGGVGGGVVVVLPALPEVLPDVLPEVPGELVLPVSVGSDFPQALKASKELKAMASAGLKLEVFMGLPFEKINFKNPTRRVSVGGARPVV